MKEKEKIITGGLVGVIAGLLLSTGIDIMDSPTRRARVIEEKDMPRVIKVYNESTDADRILIENPKNAGEYIPLSVYLEKEFDNKYERNLERARIKLSVSQGEGK